MNYLIQQTQTFTAWHSSVRDLRAKIAIARRIERGGVVIVLLAGGDKSSQSADIRRAKKLAKEI